MRTLQLITLALLATAARADIIVNVFGQGDKPSYLFCCDSLSFGAIAFPSVDVFLGKLEVTGFMGADPPSDIGFTAGSLLSHVGDTWTFNAGTVNWNGPVYTHGLSRSDCQSAGGFAFPDFICGLGSMVDGPLVGESTLTRKAPGEYNFTAIAQSTFIPSNHDFSPVALQGPLSVDLFLDDNGLQPLPEERDFFWKVEWSDPIHTPVPEPSTFALLAGVCALALWRSRHRERR